MPDIEPVWLTYREAAAKVQRTRRAIQYWRARGMPMQREVRDGQRVRVVELETLQAWRREWMKHNTAHQRHLRAVLAAQARSSSDTP